MSSIVVSFRLDEQEIELLKRFGTGEESCNQIAARIVRDSIGATIKTNPKANLSIIVTEEIDRIVKEQLKYIMSNCELKVERCKSELMQEIEALKNAQNVSEKKPVSKAKKSGTSTVKKPTKNDNEVVE